MARGIIADIHRIDGALPVRTNGHTLGAIGVVVGCTLGNLVSVTPVINGTFGIFLVPVTEALGWSRSEFSVVLLIMAIVGVVGYPVAGYLADRFGVRPVALIGNALFAACVAGLALSSPQHAWVYALYAITGLVATFSSCVLLMKPVSLWFTRHRGLLFALTGAFGINIGIAVIPFFVNHIMADYGWRAAYVGLAAFTFLVGFPSMMLLKNPPAGEVGATAAVDQNRSERASVESGATTSSTARAQSAGTPPGAPTGGDLSAHLASQAPLPGLTSREARRLPAFWLLMFSVALGAGSLSALLTHMVPLLTDRGIPLATATTAFATTALCNASWQIVIGMMLDRSKAPRFAGIFLVVSIAGLVLIGYASHPAWLLVGAVLLGIGSGTEYGLLPCVIPRYFGVRSFSELYGTIFGVSILVSGFTPLLMGLAFDTQGNYNSALIAIGVALACSAALLFAMRPYGSAPAGKETTAEPGSTLATVR